MKNNFHSLKFSLGNSTNVHFSPWNKEPKNGQQPLFQIPGASCHRQINAITDSTFQIVPCHSIIRLQVADNGFNRGTPPALFSLLVFLVPGILLERLSRQNDLRSIDFITFAAVAAIAYGLPSSFPARNLNMPQYLREYDCHAGSVHD